MSLGLFYFIMGLSCPTCLVADADAREGRAGSAGFNVATSSAVRGEASRKLLRYDTPPPSTLLPAVHLERMYVLACSPPFSLCFARSGAWQLKELHISPPITQVQSGLHVAYPLIKEAKRAGLSGRSLCIQCHCIPFCVCV